MSSKNAKNAKKCKKVYFDCRKYYNVNFNFMSVKKIMSCQFIGCTTRAYFNFPKTQPGVLCASHRLAGMVNVYDKTCKVDECSKRPLFNFPGEKRGVVCKEHSEVGMVDLQNPKCPGCKKYGGFNYP